MKSLPILLLIVSGLTMSLFSQNRICGWETDKITSVAIEFTHPDQEKKMNIFNLQHDIDSIIFFLKEVEFRSFDRSSTGSPDLKDDLECKITFQGQRDQVYLFRHHAFIGKTSFLIDPGVFEDFESLIIHLTHQASD